MKQIRDYPVATTESSAWQTIADFYRDNDYIYPCLGLCANVGEVQTSNEVRLSMRERLIPEVAASPFSPYLFAPVERYGDPDMYYNPTNHRLRAALALQWAKETAIQPPIA